MPLMAICILHRIDQHHGAVENHAGLGVGAGGELVDARDRGLGP